MRNAFSQFTKFLNVLAIFSGPREGDLAVAEGEWEGDFLAILERFWAVLDDFGVKKGRFDG